MTILAIDVQARLQINVAIVLAIQITVKNNLFSRSLTVVIPEGVDVMAVEKPLSGHARIIAPQKPFEILQY